LGILGPKGAHQASTSSAFIAEPHLLMLLTFISLEFLEHELTNIVFPYLTTVNSNNSIFTKEKTYLANWFTYLGPKGARPVQQDGHVNWFTPKKGDTKGFCPTLAC
jgi:hypothetical protein